MAGWEVEGFISRLTKRDNMNSERLVLEAISHLRGFSRDCDGLRERATRAEAERDALGDAMRKLVDKLTEIERHPAFGTVFALASMRGMGYSGPNWEPELTDLRLDEALAVIARWGSGKIWLSDPQIDLVKDDLVKEARRVIDLYAMQALDRAARDQSQGED